MFYTFDKKSEIRRYTKSLELLAEMIPLSYPAYLFDNSSETGAFLQIAEIYRAKELTINI